MTFRPATMADCPGLAEMNHQLIRDEGHRNPMTPPQLEERMRGWLAADYRAYVGEDGNASVVYSLFREQADEIYLRQLFVARGVGAPNDGISSDGSLATPQTVDGRGPGRQHRSGGFLAGDGLSGLFPDA